MTDGDGLLDPGGASKHERVQLLKRRQTRLRTLSEAPPRPKHCKGIFPPFGVVEALAVIFFIISLAFLVFQINDVAILPTDIVKYTEFPLMIFSFLVTFGIRHLPIRLGLELLLIVLAVWILIEDAFLKDNLNLQDPHSIALMLIYGVAAGYVLRIAVLVAGLCCRPGKEWGDGGIIC